MFIQVRLLEGFPKPLFYSAPREWNLEINSVIKVPIRNKTTSAIVVKIFNSPPKNLRFKVREACSIEPFPKDTKYSGFVGKVSRLYFSDELHFYKRVRLFLKLKEPKYTEIKPPQNSAQVVTLTHEQQAVVDYLSPIVETPKYSPTLLHGVTGSGKTEVYVKLITQALKNKRSALFLLPEVTLSMQFEKKLKNKLPAGTPLFGFHSATKVSEKKILWQRLLNGEPTVIVGVHLPVLLPILNLGLIIIDEEHEIGFQEKKHPKLNSKELAILRASIYSIPILLGSATPSLSSLHSVKARGWKFFQLKNRFSGNFPSIQKVMLSKNRARKNFWITIELEKAIRETISKKEQALIFLNRRGFSSFLMCKECSFVFECPECSVSLTVHKGESESLQCHYCAYGTPFPELCPSCKAPENKLFRRGIGTQQIVSILQKFFPDAIIKRADLDTTSKKNAWDETVRLCEEGKVDILVGTQSITKGYHFPKVTLVGVLWADMSLHYPMYNASEVAIQQLLQVAGRAGRETSQSTVIMQVMDDHHIFNFMNEVDYLKFYSHEMEFRKLAGYPPLNRFLLIELKNTNPYIVDQDAEKLCNKLLGAADGGVDVLGPVRPIVHRIQKSEIRHIYIKAPSFKEASKLLTKIDTSEIKSLLYVVPTQ